MKLAKRFVRMARPYWGVLAVAVLGLVGAALLNLVTPEIVRRLTARLGSPELLSAGTLLLYAGILTGAYLLKAFCRYLSMYCNHIAAWRFVGDLIAGVYEKLQTLSLRYYSDKQTGQLMSRLVNDTRQMEVLIAHALPDLLSNLLVIVTVAVMIFLINPTLAALTLIPVPFVLGLSLLFSRKVAPLFRRNQEVLGDLSGTLQDNLSGIREIQAFCKEEGERSRIRDFCRFYSEVNIHANRANAIYQPAVELLTSIGTIIVVGVGGLLAMQGRMNAADIVGFFMYLSLFYQPLMTLARLVEDVQTAYAGGVRALEVIDAESEIREAPDARSIGPARGELAFSHVSFHYQTGEPVLRDISFTARPGEMIALVGATGVGKTTLVSLIERFYDPCEGAVLLDGVDIRTLTLRSLRDNLSMVLQDVFLFNGSVEDNIAYGVEGATHEQIVEAAKAASAHSFISELPDGYATRIGERGTRLSGGQKQRIAIARAVLRQAPVLILDEATSAVDTETEAEIQRAIDNLAGKRTILVIAHRLSTVRRADRILVLEQGCIAEQGRHEELLEKGGLYAALCRAQNNRLGG